MKLLDAVSANGAGTGQSLGDGLVSRNRQYTFYTSATDYDGGTVTLLASFDGGTTYVSTGITSTADLAQSVSIRATHVRADLAGATTPVAVTAVLL